jgi:hypothetical protein
MPSFPSVVCAQSGVWVGGGTLRLSVLILTTFTLGFSIRTGIATLAAVVSYPVSHPASPCSSESLHLALVVSLGHRFNHATAFLPKPSVAPSYLEKKGQIP